jgi:Na+-driven multidrug efflux pump
MRNPSRVVSSWFHPIYLILWASLWLYQKQISIQGVKAWCIQPLSRLLLSRKNEYDRRFPRNEFRFSDCITSPVGNTLWSILPEQEESSISIPLTDPSTVNKTLLNSSIGNMASLADVPLASVEQNVNEPSDSIASTTSIVPTYSKLLLFASTTVIIWLSEPLLSLVDTTIIGQFASSSSSIIQLASLGPATTYIDSLFYTTYFLSIATTNVIARNLAQKNYEELQRIVSHVSSIAAVLGSICTLFTFVAAPLLLPLMAGQSGTPQLLLYSTRYVFIRASVAIASILAITSQSICLATQDTLTPAMAVLATSITNVVGDIMLRHYGVQGAAVATALATLVSCSILLRAVYQQWIQWRKLMPISTDMSKASAKDRTTVSSSHRQSSLLSMFTWPDRKSAYQLITLAGPYVLYLHLSPCFTLLLDTTDIVDHSSCSRFFRIFFVIVAKVMCYGAMTIRCTNFGVEALAAHSIMMRLFFFFACFGDSLSQVAQSFMPAVLFHNRPTSHANTAVNGEASASLQSAEVTKQKRISDLTLMLRRLLVVGAWVGVVNSQISTTLVKYFGQHLTKDFVITNLMKKYCSYMGLSLLVHPFIMLLEGIVLANRDFRSLIVTYAITMGMHFTILSNFSNSFPAVWRTFFLFQCTRLSLYAYRVFRWWWKLRLPVDSSFVQSDTVEVSL